MLLRRVIDHVREQEWTAIWIDLVIVVVGVFIGIQVANWNTALADKRLGLVYATRLTADLEQDLASRRALVAYYGAVLDSVERTDALLADPTADPQALLVAAYRATEINYPPPSEATWSEVVSSGDTGLLPRNAGRLVADYFAFDASRNAFDVLMASAYRHRVRMIIPLAVQKELRAGCSDVRNEAQQITGFMPGCTLEITPGAIEATVAVLRADPAVLASLRYQYSEVNSGRANIQGEVVAIERALAELNNLPPPTGATP